MSSIPFKFSINSHTKCEKVVVPCQKTEKNCINQKPHRTVSRVLNGTHDLLSLQYLFGKYSIPVSVLWWIKTQPTILEDILLVESVISKYSNKTKTATLGHEILVISLYFL